MSSQTTETAIAEEPRFAARMLRMLLADKFALCAAIFLLFILILVIIGPSWLGDLATKQNLRGRNAAPSTGNAAGSGGWGRMRSAGRCLRASSSRRRTR